MSKPSNGCQNFYKLERSNFSLVILFKEQYPDRADHRWVLELARGFDLTHHRESSHLVLPLSIYYLAIYDLIFLVVAVGIISLFSLLV